MIFVVVVVVGSALCEFYDFWVTHVCELRDYFSCAHL